MTSKKEPTIVDSPRGWLICAGFAYVVMLNYATCRTLGIFLKDWQEDFAVSRSSASWVPSTCFAVVAIGTVWTPILSRLEAPRMIVFIAGIMAFGGIMAASFAPTLTVLILLCVVGFSGAAIVYGITFACLGQHMNRYRPLAFSLAQSGSAIGAMAFPYLFRWLADEYSWRGCVLLLGALFLNFSAVGLIIRQFVPTPVPTLYRIDSVTTPDDQISRTGPTTSPPQSTGFLEGKQSFAKDHLEDDEFQRTPTSGTGDVNSMDDSSPSTRINTANIKINSGTSPKETPIHKQLRFLIILPYTVFHFAGFTPMVIYLPSLAAKRNCDTDQVSFIIMVLGIADLAFRVSSGFFLSIPKIRSKLLLLLIGNEIVLVTASAFFAASSAYIHLVFTAVIFGFSYGGWFVMFFSFLGDFYGPQHLSSTIGLTLSCSGAVQLGMPPLLGYIAEVTSFFEVIFITTAVCLTISTLILVILMLYDRKLKSFLS